MATFGLKGFLKEARRRRVFRVTAIYIVGAWIALQAADLAFPGLGIEESAILYVWIGAILGLPIALFFGWRYDIVGGRIVRTPASDVDADLSIGRADYIILAALSVVVVVTVIGLIGQISGTRIPQTTQFAVTDIDPNSIAVLPFVNMSDDPEQEYFSDGLSETLIHVLAQVGGLKVAAKTSSFYFKGKNTDVGEIAHKLNVGTILEGSVQKAGNQVRVIAELVNVRDGSQLWSESFDRELKDIFAIQDEIAGEVVKALEVTLLDNEEERLRQRYRPTFEAYEQLILGRQAMAKLTADSLDAAERHFKKAIELDPDFALAYVSLARTYVDQIAYSGLPLEEALQRQERLVDKALELDPLSAEAYATKAYVGGWRKTKLPEEDLNPEEDILKALDLNPSSAEIHYQYGGWLIDVGRFEEGLSHVRMAAKLDPMSPSIQTRLAGAIWHAGRVEEALTLIRRNIERTPEFPDNYDMMADFQTLLGQLGEAQLWRQEARRRNPGATWTWLFECIGFLNLGDWPSAEECAKQLAEANPEKLTASNIWLPLNVYSGEFNAAIAKAESVHDRLPGWGAYSRILADLIAGQGEIERARSLMADAYPELLEDDLVLDRQGQLHAAKNFAAILHANGETQRRDVLLEAIEERIASMHRIRGVSYGVLDVYVYAIRGDRERAIAALREAINEGWKVAQPFPLDGNWWTLRRDWKLEILHQDPEFIAVMNELEADIHMQRQWYEKHKNEPIL